MMNRRDNVLKKIKNSVNGDGIVVNLDFDDDSIFRFFRRRVRVNDMDFIGESEVRVLYKVILKFGNLKEILDELIVDGILSVKLFEKYGEIYDEMMEVVKDCVYEEEKNRKEILEKFEKYVIVYRVKLKSGEIKVEN